MAYILDAYSIIYFKPNSFRLLKIFNNNNFKKIPPPTTRKQTDKDKEGQTNDIFQPSHTYPSSFI
jgi:hypothetical protein